MTLLGDNSTSDAFEVDVDSVRQIPRRGDPIPASSIQEGARYECWYAQEGEYYNATVNIVIEYSTAVVLFDGFEDQEEVPLKYLVPKKTSDTDKDELILRDGTAKDIVAEEIKNEETVQNVHGSSSSIKSADEELAERLQQELVEEEECERAAREQEDAEFAAKKADEELAERLQQEFIEEEEHERVAREQE